MSVEKALKGPRVRLVRHLDSGHRNENHVAAAVAHLEMRALQRYAGMTAEEIADLSVGVGDTVRVVVAELLIDSDTASYQP
jgi:hypothetical protein